MIKKVVFVFIYKATVYLSTCQTLVLKNLYRKTGVNPETQTTKFCWLLPLAFYCEVIPSPPINSVIIYCDLRSTLHFDFCHCDRHTMTSNWQRQQWHGTSRQDYTLYHQNARTFDWQFIFYCWIYQGLKLLGTHCVELFTGWTSLLAFLRTYSSFCCLNVFIL